MSSNHAKSEIDLDELELYLKEAMGLAAETNDGVVIRARMAGSALHVISELRASRRVIEAAKEYRHLSLLVREKPQRGEARDFAGFALDAALSEHGRD